MAKSTSNDPFAISVVGGGLAGLTTALQLTKICETRDQLVALIAPLKRKPDKRTTAMMTPSIEALSSLGVWGDMQQHSAALSTMRLVDGSKRLIRAPITDFKASEMGMEAFGFNVPNDKMIAALEKKISETPSIVRFDNLLINAECNDDEVLLTLDSKQQIYSQLAVAADGKKSILREAAGIQTREWSYPQTALVLNFKHTLPHNGISTEFHTETGPFTQVPLPATKERPHRSSLVWVVNPNEVDVLLKKPLSELSAIVERKLQSSFGAIMIEDKPQAFPLAGMTARSFGSNRVVLVSEAAHVFPPIGAQGFNLGIRDIVDLGKVCSTAADDFGSRSITSSYNRKRMPDIHSRTGGVDLLNRSLLTDFLPVQVARAVGLSVLGNVTWIRKLAMRNGLGAKDNNPSPFKLPFINRGRGPEATGQS